MKKNEMGGLAWGGGGVLVGILGGTVPPGSSNHDPISHQEMFSTPVFIPRPAEIMSSLL